MALLGMGRPAFIWAQASNQPKVSGQDDEIPQGGFAKPYEFERQAYGYDPEGFDYKENQAEDFTVIFITSAPFTAMASFGITGFVSLLSRNSFDVGGDYFLPFLGGILAGSTTIACVSVLTNPYPPPSKASYVDEKPGLGPLVWRVPLITARF